MTDETSLESPDQRILEDDCIETMQEMDADSVHAVVTDPPYGLAFMGRSWDDFEPKEYQQWCEKWATEALRVLKPGGHLIAFSGNRTHHRLFSAVEDAGFTIRDTITYHYGTGFPKGSDISKHINRYYDAEDEREVVGENPNARDGHGDGDYEFAGGDSFSRGSYSPITKPATSEAEKWDGWRSQLKPATEFAVLARAPMSESAVYRNVLEHGTGALNIDRTRIPTEEDLSYGSETHESGKLMTPKEGAAMEQHDEGRYPANLLLDGVASRMLDSQSGTLESGTAVRENVGISNTRDKYGEYDGADTGENVSYGGSGGASRFFYTAKASKSERTIDGQIDNEHPTVKPLGLMEWLVTLVTAPGQRILDPFAGSGTTIMACKRLNREGIGIEKDEDHSELARKRVELAHEIETENVPATEPESTDTDSEENTDDSGPATLESFGDDD